MNISALLQAAEYLERRERGPVFPEHGYASLLPITNDLRNSKPKHNRARRPYGNRTSHNELEKNRRAHLRHCLERLKEMVPIGPESHRHTTLGLLTRAKSFIKTLEDREKKHQVQKDRLFRDQTCLRKRYEQLNVQLQAAGITPASIHLPPVANPQPHFRSLLKRRSNSECSTSTLSISSLVSETDENDNTDYHSHGSDSDELCSINSSSSDSGVMLSPSSLIDSF